MATPFALIVLLFAPFAVAVPMPNPRQLAFMESEMIQFMHFGIPTFWDAPESFLRGPNPTYHDCLTTSVDNHTNQTGAYWPCLDPIIFAPTELDAARRLDDAGLARGEVEGRARQELGGVAQPAVADEGERGV